MTQDPTTPLRAALAQAPVQQFIDGDFRAPCGDGLIDIHDPATGALLSQASAGEAGDIDAAVMAARQAFDDGRWSGLPPHDGRICC
ncbi:hypothetical protein [Pararhodobacter zhoushanensis]|uniref:Aldehyde dehydrogenase domain-containing protein n=1 Tax=Pararhodobacter zhoushanensis TaxID=2479545 RepID=A0ABT3GV37_9RHOB|nr:hypothetical protein [Pararhodobacter zhoushanensis]MCW1931413.1 hypothetical protein [Pararhodobacter zhoushanensis]